MGVLVGINQDAGDSDVVSTELTGNVAVEVFRRDDGQRGMADTGNEYEE